MGRNLRWAGVLGLLALFGCTGGESAPSKPSGKEDVPPPTNRIDVPPTVRRNLGITFAKVERRRVAATMRAPGRFELLQKALREYHATLAGRVELLVDQYARVEQGAPLYRIDSPQWRDMQQQLTRTMLAIRQAAQRLESVRAKAAAIDKHSERLRDEEKVWEERVAQVEALIAAGSGAASELTEARSQLASTRTSLAEVEEEQADAARARSEIETELASYGDSMPLLFADALGVPAEGPAEGVDLAFAPATAMLGIPVEELRRKVGAGDRAVFYWRTIDRVEVRARQPGVVETLAVTNGAWVETSDLLLTTVEPAQIRFRAVGLQADLGRLRDGMPARIVPPRGGTHALEGSLSGELALGLQADPLERKIDLIVVPAEGDRPGWARRGVSAELEIVLDETAEPQLAIPLNAVIQDGLEKVFFRRDPKDPNKVIRLEADLGLSDGRWVVLASGVVDGDEVVHHGVYELMLASGGAKLKGGHFHADGTYHEGSHD